MRFLVELSEPNQLRAVGAFLAFCAPFVRLGMDQDTYKQRTTL